MADDIRIAKILVGTDFSNESIGAIRQAIGLAEKCGAEVTVAHVLADVRQAMIDMPANLREKESEEDLAHSGEALRAQSERQLEKILAPFSGRGVKLRHVTLLGAPHVALVHLVQAESFELLIVATRGLGAVKRILVGSTAERLVRDCPCAVWVVKGEGEQLPKNLLVAVDFTVVCGKALELAEWLAVKNEGEITALHVVPDDVPPELSVPGEESPAPVLAAFRRVRRAAKGRLADFVAKHLTKGIPLECHVAKGAPWRAVSDRAVRWKVDLLMMGSITAKSIPGFVIGRNAEKILRTCDVSILSVKPDDYVSPILPAFWSLYPGATALPQS